MALNDTGLQIYNEKFFLARSPWTINDNTDFNSIRPLLFITCIIKSTKLIN